MTVNDPAIAAGGTSKREGKGFTMVGQVPVIPPAPYVYRDEDNALVYIDLTPQREGQMVCVVEPDSQSYGTLYVVADVGGGVLEWKVAA